MVIRSTAAQTAPEQLSGAEIFARIVDATGREPKGDPPEVRGWCDSTSQNSMAVSWRLWPDGSLSNYCFVCNSGREFDRHAKALGIDATLSRSGGSNGGTGKDLPNRLPAPALMATVEPSAPTTGMTPQARRMLASLVREGREHGPVKAYNAYGTPPQYSGVAVKFTVSDVGRVHATATGVRNYGWLPILIGGNPYETRFITFDPQAAFWLAECGFAAYFAPTEPTAYHKLALNAVVKDCLAHDVPLVCHHDGSDGGRLGAQMLVLAAAYQGVNAVAYAIPTRYDPEDFRADVGLIASGIAAGTVVYHPKPTQTALVEAGLLSPDGGSPVKGAPDRIPGKDPFPLNYAPPEAVAENPPLPGILHWKLAQYAARIADPNWRGVIEYKNSRTGALVKHQRNLPSEGGKGKDAKTQGETGPDVYLAKGLPEYPMPAHAPVVLIEGQKGMARCVIQLGAITFCAIGGAGGLSKAAWNELIDLCLAEGRSIFLVQDNDAAGEGWLADAGRIATQHGLRVHWLNPTTLAIKESIDDYPDRLLAAYALAWDRDIAIANGTPQLDYIYENGLETSEGDYLITVAATHSSIIKERRDAKSRTKDKPIVDYGDPLPEHKCLRSKGRYTELSTGGIGGTILRCEGCEGCMARWRDRTLAMLPPVPDGAEPDPDELPDDVAGDLDADTRIDVVEVTSGDQMMYIDTAIKFRGKQAGRNYRLPDGKRFPVLTIIMPEGVIAAPDDWDGTPPADAEFSVKLIVWPPDGDDPHYAGWLKNTEAYCDREFLNFAHYPSAPITRETLHDLLADAVANGKTMRKPNGDGLRMVTRSNPPVRGKPKKLPQQDKAKPAFIAPEHDLDWQTPRVKVGLSEREKMLPPEQQALLLAQYEANREAHERELRDRPEAALTKDLDHWLRGKGYFHTPAFVRHAIEAKTTFHRDGTGKRHRGRAGYEVSPINIGIIDPAFNAMLGLPATDGFRDGYWAIYRSIGIPTRRTAPVGATTLVATPQAEPTPAPVAPAPSAPMFEPEPVPDELLIGDADFANEPEFAPPPDWDEIALPDWPDLDDYAPTPEPEQEPEPDAATPEPDPDPDPAVAAPSPEPNPNPDGELTAAEVHAEGLRLLAAMDGERAAGNYDRLRELLREWPVLWNQRAAPDVGEPPADMFVRYNAHRTLVGD